MPSAPVAETAPKKRSKGPLVALVVGLVVVFCAGLPAVGGFAWWMRVRAASRAFEATEQAAAQAAELAQAAEAAQATGATPPTGGLDPDAGNPATEPEAGDEPEDATPPSAGRTASSTSGSPSTTGSKGTGTQGKSQGSTAAASSSSTSSSSSSSAAASASSTQPASSTGKTGSTKSSSSSASGGPYEVKFTVQGSEAKLKCGDGQQRSFVGTTRLSFQGVVSCRVDVGGGKGAVQVSSAASYTCTATGNSVQCVKG
jgi:cytoskeletal protein RodZ